MQEPTGYVFIQTVDGEIEKVEKDVALLSPYVHREVNRHGRGYSRDSPVALPKQVSPAVLKLILDYCRFHRVSGRSDKVRSPLARLKVCWSVDHILCVSCASDASVVSRRLRPLEWSRT